MAKLSCGLEECDAFEVREWFSDEGNAKCCECGISIPDGERRAVVENITLFDGDWDVQVKHQHLECYRFMRKLRFTRGFCASLGSFEPCLDGEYNSCVRDQWYFLDLEWAALKSGIRNRLQKGVGPWIFEDGHPHAFMDDQEWAACISSAWRENECSEYYNTKEEELAAFKRTFGFDYVEATNG